MSSAQKQLNIKLVKSFQLLDKIKIIHYIIKLRYKIKTQIYPKNNVNKIASDNNKSQIIIQNNCLKQIKIFHTTLIIILLFKNTQMISIQKMIKLSIKVS